MLDPFKWRSYIYDIVRFITNEKYLKWFLDFDPDCFFKLMKIIFLEDDPYEYIASQHSFIEMYKDSIKGLEQCMTHSEIIDILHKVISNNINKEKEYFIEIDGNANNF